MTAWILGLKRLLRPGRVLLLLAVALCIVFAGQVGGQAKMRPCGLVVEDSDPAAAAVADKLTGQGFLLYEDREALRQAVGTGVIDCGAVLQVGVGEGIRENDLKSMVLMYVSPMSFLSEAYEANVLSALYTASSPARTVQAAEKVGITLDEQAVAERLEAFFAEGYRFRFDVQSVNGASFEEEAFGPTLRQAACALLLFGAVIPVLWDIGQDTKRMSRRIGRRLALRTIALPMGAELTLLTFAIGLLARVSVLTVLSYALLLWALGILCARLPETALCLLMPLWLVGSLALYPIYFNVGAVWDWCNWAKLLFPPCWFPWLMEHPALGCALGGAALAIVYALERRRADAGI